MPAYLKALVVILALASVVFAIAKVPACAMASTGPDFVRRRKLWFGITLIGFFAHNFWLYMFGGAILLLIGQVKEANKLALYFLLLFALPPIQKTISVGSMSVFDIQYYRLLALTILLPSYLLLRRTNAEPFGRLLPDKLIGLYMVLTLVLYLGVTSFTNSFRYGVIYNFTDIFLPYYVASRSLNDIQRFRDSLMAFVVAALMLSATGIFEFLRHWLLYADLEGVLGARSVLSHYVTRGTNLRALATVGGAIPLGYVIAVAIGLHMYLRKVVPNTNLWILGLLLLIGGIVSSLSRGPWVGAALICMIVVATSPLLLRNLIRIALVGIVLSPLLFFTEKGQHLLEYLPFVGKIQSENVDYRRQLIEVSMVVLMKNPFFGSFNYLQAPEMQVLRQGEGIIDIVNTYIGVVLSFGLVGLSLFAGFFTTIALGIFTTMRKIIDHSDERYMLGQALFATWIGIMATIFTVSSITAVPVVYWAMAGVGVAYIRLLAPKVASRARLRGGRLQSPRPTPVR